jgi:nicotinate-nucleotide adenylyltransferase
MVALAIEGNPRFVLDDRELRREGRSYTYDTLTAIRSEVNDRTICLFMGADAFVALTTWHRWVELFDLAHVAVVNRPGYPLDQLANSLPGPLRREYLKRHTSDGSALGLAPAGRIFTHAFTAMDVSGTALRENIRYGRSPRYLLPDGVIAYIRENGLYKE